MKTLKQLLLTGIAVLLCTLIYAQVPQKFNYQAVARNNNAIIANGPVGVQLTVTDANGTIVYYRETQSVTTNVFGIFSLEVGGGTPVIGTFSSIDWKSGDKWLNVQIDPTGGTTYTDMGSSELIGVPYSLYAANGWDVNGNDISSPNTGTVNIANGNLALNGNELRLQSAADGNHIVTYDSNVDGVRINGWLGGVLGESHNGTDVLRWNDFGNVGIGTGAPDKRFSIVGGMNVDQAQASDGSSGIANVALQNGLTFGNINSGEGIASNRNNANSNQSGLDFYTGWNRAMSITNAGNVGIGNPTPTARFDVQGGDINVSGKVTTNSTTDINGTSNMIPVAYGRISGSGSIINATANVQSSIQHPSPGKYVIGIDNITYDNTYTTIVTANGSSDLPVWSVTHPDGNGYQLDIYTYTPTPLEVALPGSPLYLPFDYDFSFVVYHR